MIVGVSRVNGRPSADPAVIEVRRGERIRLRLINPSMGRITFDFTADNPGDWLFHCHNLYHMEAGMARVFRYV